jgi:hypothetical protein
LQDRRFPDPVFPEKDGPLRGAVAVDEAQRLLRAEATNAGHAEAGEVDRSEAPMRLVLFVDAAHAYTS